MELKEQTYISVEFFLKLAEDTMAAGHGLFDSSEM
jgi:hypothetical protein